jgi:hypothetical protein
VRTKSGWAADMLGLENTLRSLTASPVTAALNEVRRHARRYHLEAGGAAVSAHDRDKAMVRCFPATLTQWLL